jgi:hypothetical protein
MIGRWTNDETMRLVDAVTEYLAQRDTLLREASLMQVRAAYPSP